MTYYSKPSINQSVCGLLLYESVWGGMYLKIEKWVVSLWNAMWFSNNIWDSILSGSYVPRKNKG